MSATAAAAAAAAAGAPAAAAAPAAADALDDAEAAPFPADAPARGVRPGEDMAHAAAVAAAIRAREMRRVRRDFLRSLALVLCVPVAASGWIARELMPEVRQENQFVPLAPDGTIASAHRWENLPPHVRGDVAVNTLWNYVRLRESYSHIGADYAWRVVSAMSDQRVRDEYQALHNPRNPESPWARLGEKTRIEVGYDSHIDLCPVDGCGAVPEGYQFRFWRTETVDGIRRPPVMHVAQVRFRRGVAGLDARQYYTFNAPAAQVWEYVPGRPAGANRGATP